MEQFIREIPKAEVHVHLEGTISPETLLKLASKNEVSFQHSLAELQHRRSHFASLEDFIDDYHACCCVLKDSDDFYEVLKQYLFSAHQDGVVYCEMGVCGLTHPTQPLQIQMEGVVRAAKEVYQSVGLLCKFLLIFVRHLPVDQNYRVIQEAVPYKDWIVGCGLAGTEVGYPASAFAGVFEEAKRQGLCGPDGGNISVHAGEEGDVTTILDALYGLQPRRLDHGVRALEDPALVKFLANVQMPLAIAPLANERLKVLDRFFNQEQVAGEMLSQGLKIFVNSDCPEFFGGGLVANFLAVTSTFASQSEDSVRQQVVELCKNSFAAAFLTTSEKETFCSLVTQFAQTCQ